MMNEEQLKSDMLRIAINIISQMTGVGAIKVQEHILLELKKEQADEFFNGQEVEWE